MKKIVSMMLVSLFVSSNVLAYSYAAAGKEPTIDAKEKILKAINADDFVGAKKVFKENERNYKYLTDEFIKGLYDGLATALKNENKQNVMKYLELSLAAEVQRRVDGGLQNIDTFNVAKVMLAKANKFYNLLSPSLNKAKSKELKIALKACTKAIGNPGLFGVGARKANKDDYIKNQRKVIEIIQSL